MLFMCPYTPLLYSKTVQGYSFVLLFLLLNMDRGNSIYVLSKYKNNITIFHLKIFVFTTVKNCSILHRRVIGMKYTEIDLGLRIESYSVRYMLNNNAYFIKLIYGFASESVFVQNRLRIKENQIIQNKHKKKTIRHV